MILITTGTSEYKFDRLFKYIEELCKENVIKDKEILVQCGKNVYYSEYFKSFGMIKGAEFERLVEKADYIISHAGTGSVVPALKKGKKIIVFPRLVEYNEHIDNHQIELAELFSKEGFVLYARDKKELKEKINEIDSFIPKKFISNNEKINNIIIKFIEERV